MSDWSSDFDEFKPQLTARQRAAASGDVDFVDLNSLRSKKKRVQRSSEEEALRKSEMQRKRKVQLLQKAEEEKKLTIQKLLRKQASKKSRKETKEEKQESPHLRFHSFLEDGVCKNTLSLPQGYELHEFFPMGQIPQINQKKCTNCSQKSKYVINNNLMACGLPCYKLLCESSKFTE